MYDYDNRWSFLGKTQMNNHYRRLHTKINEHMKQGIDINSQLNKGLCQQYGTPTEINRSYWLDYPIIIVRSKETLPFLVMPITSIRSRRQSTRRISCWLLHLRIEEEYPFLLCHFMENCWVIIWIHYSIWVEVSISSYDHLVDKKIDLVWKWYDLLIKFPTTNDLINVH